VLAATVPVTLHLSPIYVSAVTATVLIGLAVTNWVTWRRSPREPLPPTVPARSQPT
jgi:hypothetical protein